VELGRGIKLREIGEKRKMEGGTNFE